MSIKRFASWPVLTATVVRLTLSNYLRSRWIYLELALILVAVGLAPAGEYRSTGNGLASFFGITGPLFIVESLIGSPILARRAFGPSAYMFLARLPARVPYAAGVALAAAFLRIPLFMLAIGLAVLFGRLANPPGGWLIAGSLEMLGPACFGAALAILLSPPIGNRVTLGILIAWFAVVFRPLQATAGLPAAAGAFLDALSAPLRPVTDAIFASTDPVAARANLLSVVVLAAYVVVTGVVAGLLLERRQLDLH